MSKSCKKAVAFIMVLLLFVGCKADGGLPSVTFPYSCELRVNHKEKVIVGEWTAELLGCYRWQITQPECLRGITFACRNGQTTVGWKNWLPPNEVALPSESLFLQIADALDQAARQETAEERTASKAIYCVSGHRVEWDLKSGRPTQVLLRNGALVTT